MRTERQPFWLTRLILCNVISSFLFANESGFFADSAVLKQAALPALSVTSIQSDNIFNPHSSQFKSQATAYLIQGLKMIRQADVNLQIYITAYSDDIPNAVEQKRMTSAQAEAVANYLWSQGVDYERMHIAGEGSKHMLGEIHSSKTNAVNRRIEIVLVPAALPKQIYPVKE